MAKMTEQERAQFDIRSRMWLGGGLLAAGLGLRWLFGRMAAVGSLSREEAATWLPVSLVVILAGLLVLGVALVAVGVRLGLAAYGVSQGLPHDTDDRRARPDSP